MQHMAHLWAEMPPVHQDKMSQISFSAIEIGLREAKKTITRHSTELADEEHDRHYLAFVKLLDDLDASFADAETTIVTTRKNLHIKEEEIRSLKLINLSARAAITASARDHAARTACLFTQPRPTVSTGVHPPHPVRRQRQPQTLPRDQPRPILGPRLPPVPTLLPPAPPCTPRLTTHVSV